MNLFLRRRRCLPFSPQLIKIQRFQVFAHKSDHQDLDPDPDPLIAIPALLSDCTNLPRLSEIHGHILRTHFLLLHPFPFRWNNLLRSYTRLHAPAKALHLYLSMSRASIHPDSYTFPILLKASSLSFALYLGIQLHALAIRLGLVSNQFCESGFISIYSKSGEFQLARKVFDENPQRKLGSWNAILAGLSQAGLSRETISMFLEMRQCGFQPDHVTMVCVTSACGSLGDFTLALQLHKHVLQARNLDKPDILMMNSLIDMYGKCGRMDLACQVFSRMSEKNVSSWTSVIVGHAMHGRADEALECFGCMRESEVRPNHVTFVGVLSACVHGGKVEEGRFYFDMMRNVYGLMPQSQHYGCMVDLLGRVGLLEQAKEIVEGMPMKPNVVIWGCLMSACEKYGNVEMGEWVAKHLQELEPWNDGAYVVLSNIYAKKSLWREVEGVRVLMKQQQLAKTPAYSLL